jgi:hypothetical protein
VIATVGNSPYRGRLLASTAIATGALTLLFAEQQALGWSLVVVALLSTVSSAQIGLHVAAYQSTAPDAVRGRVTAVSSSLVQSCTAVGALVLGVFGSLAGLEVALALGGVVVLLASLVGLQSAAFRSWERDLLPNPVTSR